MSDKFNVMEWIWIFLQVLIGYNLILPLLMYVVHFLRRGRYSCLLDEVNEPDYAVIVTAYEETRLLPPLVESILKLNYSNYLIYIVADNCDVSTLNFDDERVILLKPEIVFASNTKSHFYAVDNFIRAHEILTIVDSDNLLHPEYLNELNKYFYQGFDAVQGMRAAKRTKTSSTIARLDAIRDVYYHFYDGKLLFELGSSATLSGSGMAFTTNFYIECLDNTEIKGAGFDKVLQAQIVRKCKRIAFAEKAVVYDEKTSYSQQLVRQRSRWIKTWFKYFSFGFDLIMLGVQNKSLNQFLFGLVLLRPPLFIFISLSVGCLFISVMLNSVFVYFWLLAFSAFILGFSFALKESKHIDVSYRSLLGIPKFVFFQFISLFFIKSADRRSVATKHQVDV